MIDSVTKIFKKQQQLNGGLSDRSICEESSYDEITVPVVYLFLIQHFFTALYSRFDTLQLI